MSSIGKRYVKFHLGLMNFFARLFGVLAILAGISGLLGFALMPDHSGLALSVGLLSLVIGIAFLKVKRLEPKDVPFLPDKYK